MPLAAGSKLGHYLLSELIGRGGMGEVYKALDTKLNRHVALKVLPGALANNPERMARFQREAQLLAQLNHPNIAAIYGLEDSGSHWAIVMELVEGDTLKGPLPIPEALRLAKQIADAVEYAHDKTVIHRDLKPANIKVTPEGQIKVLDFGLAKALDDAGSSHVEGNPMDSMSPTLTMGGTAAGVILGTAAYMAPEQAKGKRADRKADIWSFGVVLSEMLTGKRVFSGETMAETLASVMKEQLTFDDIPKETPTALRKLVTRCLDRDLKRRVQSMGEVRIALEDILSGAASEEPAPLPAQIAKPASKLPWALAATFLLALLALSAWSFYPRPAAPNPGAIRFTIAPPDGATLTATNSAAPQMAVSPDGKYLAFVADNDQTRSIWVRALGSLSAQKLDKTEGAVFPFWSPDSQHVAFFADDKVKRIPVSGGSPVNVANAGAGNGGAWFQDANGEGIIVFAASQTSALQRVPASGGVPAPFTKLAQGETGHTFPQFLPDGKRVLYWARGGSKPGIYVQALGSQERAFVLATSGRAVFSPPGFLLFLNDTTLMAQHFDPDTLKLTGEPVSVADEVRNGGANGRNAFSISTNGVLAYRSGGGAGDYQLTWYSRDGKTTGVALPPGPNGLIELSPDDKRVAVQRGINPEIDLWLLELTTNVFSRVTSSPGMEADAVWSPDSQRIAFTVVNGAARDIRETVIGSGKESVVYADGKSHGLEDWTRDGKQLLMRSVNTVSVIPAPEAGAAKSGAIKPQLLLDVPYRKDQFRVSPDGKWVAYGTDESGQPQVNVAAFPSFTNRRQISTARATAPLWRADGKELFFRGEGGTVLAVDVKGGATLETGPVRTLFRGPATNSTGGYVWALTRDGQRFLMLEPPGISTNTVEQLYVIANWPALVK